MAPSLAGMGIEARNGKPRIGDAEPVREGRVR